MVRYINSLGISSMTGNDLLLFPSCTTTILAAKANPTRQDLWQIREPNQTSSSYARTVHYFDNSEPVQTRITSRDKYLGVRSDSVRLRENGLMMTTFNCIHLAAKKVSVVPTRNRIHLTLLLRGQVISKHASCRLSWWESDRAPLMATNK